MLRAAPLEVWPMTKTPIMVNWLIVFVLSSYVICCYILFQRYHLLIDKYTLASIYQ
ncbi:hypothetical protein Hanom_Chr11g01026591 [Helianthus anomalus]